mmetsp:Transcript_18943/g.32381  ORF Transcript_18943/g.32381 Transcript_18943/m.32381 type:complete len:107 (+) Transcript_18943:188-508(+)
MSRLGCCCLGLPERVFGYHRVTEEFWMGYRSWGDPEWLGCCWRAMLGCHCVGEVRLDQCSGANVWASCWGPMLGCHYVGEVWLECPCGSASKTPQQVKRREQGCAP